MPTIQTPEKVNGQVTTQSGIILPPSYRSSPLAYAPGTGEIAKLQAQTFSNLAQAGFAQGVRLNRDGETLIVCWPGKGSGWDDLAMAAIVDGNVANAGIAPVVSSLISSAVQKQIAQAANAEITLTGRNYPVGNARDGIARFNDSPLGATHALERISYQLLTFNRGAPIATVPIIYQPDKWQEYGMTIVPMPEAGQKEESATHYWLEVDWEKMGTPTPYMPDPLRLEHTGNQEWPYWYRVSIDQKERWVLLHSSQIIELIPGYSTAPGVGTSAAWLCTEQLAVYILYSDAFAERLINAPTDGFLGISGVQQDAKQIKDKIESERAISRAKGRTLDKGFTVLTSQNPIDFKSFSFRDTGNYTEEEKQRIEDRVAANFRMSLGELGISRAGVGHAAQAQTTRDMAADSGVGYLLSLISNALGAIYKRVQVSVNRPNDYARVRQLEDLNTFANAVGSLPDGTLDRAEIRSLMETLLGVKIPRVDDSVTTTPGSKDDSTDPGVNDGQAEDQAPAEDDNAQLHRQIEAMLFEAYRLRHFAPVEDVLNGATGDRLYQRWFDGLKAQYDSADVKKIVNEIRRLEIGNRDPDFVAKVTPIVKRFTKKLQKTINRPGALAALLAMAKEGRLEAEDQARQAEVDGLTRNQRAEVDRSVETNINKRLDQLLIKATGDPNRDSDRLDLTDQRAKQILDVRSFEEVARLFWAAMWDNFEIDVIERVYLESVPGAVQPRAGLIATVEGSRAYNDGFAQSAKKLGATQKRWEHTTSLDPREIHLAIVGEVVGINQRFSSGDNWAGELFGCKCAITLLFG